MSMDDENDENDEGRGFRWPMSPVNTVLVGVFLLVAVVLFIAGQPRVGVPVLLGALGAGIGAIFARRGKAGDFERINAMEYADERDRTAATKGLAVVGAVALILGMAQVLIFTLIDIDPRVGMISVGSLLALLLAWMLGNWYFVRRG